ncbi:DUF5954 family protein [Streptomyces sp. NPDC055013]
MRFPADVRHASERAMHTQGGRGVPGLKRADEARVTGREFGICRGGRLIRVGPDGRRRPPRQSDVDEYDPMKIHPTPWEDGTIIHAA